MDGFCVILSGRLPGNKDDSSVWAPLKAAFDLDDASFEQRVVAAVPLIVRQNLDEQAAADLVQQMVASGVDAAVMQDDAQLAYFEREGTRRGPVPRSGLGHFIKLNERYRLRGEQDWSVWGGPPTVAVPPALEPVAAADLAPADQPVASEATQPDVSAHAHESDASAGAVNEPVAPGSPISHAVEGTPSPLPVEPAPRVDEEHGDEGEDEENEEVDQDVSENSREASILSPVPGDGETSALEYKSLEPPSRSNAGLWIILVIIVAIAAAAFGWSSMKHDAASLATPASPASTLSPSSATAVESSADHASMTPSAPAKAMSASGPATSTTAAQTNTGSPATPGTSSGSATAAAAGPTSRSSLPRHCEARAINPQAAEEVALLSDGKNHLTGRNVRAGAGGELFIVEAALGYDSECRPNPFQVYVFSGGKLAGTLSPQPMQARTDGAISSFKLIDPEHLQVEVAHYKSGDSPCCASSQDERIVDLEQFIQAAQIAAPIKTTSSSPASGNGAAGRALMAGSSALGCAKASSPTDSVICADSALGSLDIKVATTYRQATVKATSDNRLSLEGDQQQWLQYRSRCNADKDCIARQSKARIALLQAQFNLK